MNAKKAWKLFREGRRLVNDAGSLLAAGTAFISEVQSAAERIEEQAPLAVERVKAAAAAMKKPPAKKVDIKVEVMGREK